MTDAGAEILRYTYRLRPGVKAEKALMDEWSRCRWIWNQSVHLQQCGAKLTSSHLSKLLTEARANNSWLREGARAPQADVMWTYIKELSRSYTVRGRRRPTFKKRKESRPSLGYPGDKFTFRDGRLVLSRGITIPMVWSRDLPSTPSSVRVYRDSIGHWYASFVVTRKRQVVPAATGAIGIDWGVTTTATTTDSAYDLPFGGHRARCVAQLGRLQRRMSRRRRPRGRAQSKGYRNAQRQVAKLYKKAARQNAHESRRWAQSVVSDHQLIAIEDFRPRFLARSTMAKKAADAAIASTKRELIDQAQRAGRDVVLVRSAFTTMTCSECGTKAKDRLGLGERIFRCSACGYAADRDRNAARTILATAENDRAGVDDVRRSTGAAVAVKRSLSQEAPTSGGSNARSSMVRALAGPRG